MAICIVVPIINNGMGWGGAPYVPAGKRSAYICYRRKNPDEKNGWFLFKEYVCELDKAEKVVACNGFRFEAYGYEQDGYFERVELTDADKYRYRHIV